MSGDARDLNIETRAVIKYFFLQGKAPKKIYTILIETLGKHSPSYATVKNWVAQFKSGDLKGCHFPSDTEVNPASETWLDGQTSDFFLIGLQKLESNGLRSVLSFVVNMLNKWRVWSL